MALFSRKTVEYTEPLILAGSIVYQQNGTSAIFSTDCLVLSRGSDLAVIAPNGKILSSNIPENRVRKWLEQFNEELPEEIDKIIDRELIRMEKEKLIAELKVVDKEYNALGRRKARIEKRLKELS